MKNKTSDELSHLTDSEIMESKEFYNPLPVEKVNRIADFILVRNKVTILKSQIKKLTDDERKELLVFLRDYIYMKGDTC